VVEVPLVTYWSDTDLDLTGAHLIDFDLTRCTTQTVLFTEATFTGPARFDSATFTGHTNFEWVTFTSHTSFSSATFNGEVPLEVTGSSLLRSEAATAE
jgi:uncharacterized protein YjbI with pentapeptide repeats